MTRRLAVLVVLALAACGPAEIRIDGTKGVPAVKGQTEINLGTYTCGQPITAGTKTVATKVVSGGCEFTFDDTIEVLSASNYQDIGELKVAANLVQRVEMSINALTFTDGTSGAALDLSTRVTSVTLAVNGQAVADKSALTHLPTVVSLSGDALTVLKAKVDARQPASVAVKVVAVLPDTPAPPAKLKLDYDAQPAIIIGPGKIF
jgi:hypothetical protein